MNINFYVQSQPQSVGRGISQDTQTLSGKCKTVRGWLIAHPASTKYGSGGVSLGQAADTSRW